MVLMNFFQCFRIELMINNPKTNPHKLASENKVNINHCLIQNYLENYLRINDQLECRFFEFDKNILA